MHDFYHTIKREDTPEQLRELCGFVLQAFHRHIDSIVSGNTHSPKVATRILDPDYKLLTYWCTEISTKYGTLYITPTGQDRLQLETHQGYGEERKGHDVAVNGIAIEGNVTLQKIGGVWVRDHDHLRRCSDSFTETTPNARSAFLKECCRVATEFADANPRRFVYAEAINELNRAKLSLNYARKAAEVMAHATLQVIPHLEAATSLLGPEAIAEGALGL